MYFNWCPVRIGTPQLPIAGFRTLSLPIVVTNLDEIVEHLAFVIRLIRTS